ncbi:MAG: hypothetical protein JWN75_1209 [Candidatus Saccharibacteria bacterium]|nr:hypothetical protein [Candidatus Saccharibacteria bacterium]
MTDDIDLDNVSDDAYMRYRAMQDRVDWPVRRRDTGNTTKRIGPVLFDPIHYRKDIDPNLTPVD